MFKAMVKHTVTSNTTDRVKKALDELSRMDVFVGIPQDDAKRPPGDSGSNSRGAEPITNAQLLYIQEHGVRAKEMRSAMQGDIDQGVPYSRAHQLFIHEHGSPLWQIPPRPVLLPAIASVKAQIAMVLKKAAQAALDGDAELARKRMEIAGDVASRAAKEWFTNPHNGWPPNSPVTIDGSKRGKDGKKFIKGKGSDTPLIDTGAMRQAITYVVSEK